MVGGGWRNIFGGLVWVDIFFVWVEERGGWVEVYLGWGVCGNFLWVGGGGWTFFMGE